MKKNIITAAILCISCVSFLLFTSCGATETPANNTNAESGEESTADSSQSVEETTPKKEDIFGVINEIIGNLVTIDFAVMPETGFPVPQSGRTMNIDPDNLPEGVVISDDGVITMEDGSTLRMGRGGDGEGPMFSGEGMPEGFEGMMPGEGQQFRMNGEGMPEGFTGEIPEGGMRGGFGGRVFLEYTGEKEEFILPIGFSIYAVTNDDDGNEVETEIELADITAGNVISVAYKEDGKTIDKIRISQVTAANQADMPNREDMTWGESITHTENIENAEATESAETTESE